MQRDTQEPLERLKDIEGRLKELRKMIEEDQCCIDMLRQMDAIRKVIEKLEAIILEPHLHTSVLEGINSGKADIVIEELMHLYTLAGKR